MATIDIRNEDVSEVNEIVFHDKMENGIYLAHKLELDTFNNLVKIKDGTVDYVFITSVEHANNLIKALNKAVDLGWLK